MADFVLCVTNEKHFVRLGIALKSYCGASFFFDGQAQDKAFVVQGCCYESEIELASTTGVRAADLSDLDRLPANDSWWPDAAIGLLSRRRRSIFPDWPRTKAVESNSRFGTIQSGPPVGTAGLWRQFGQLKLSVNARINFKSCTPISRADQISPRFDPRPMKSRTLKDDTSCDVGGGRALRSQRIQASSNA